MSRKHQQSFALIYAVLFIFLIVVTVLVSWTTAIVDLRLSNRNQYSAEAYQMARSAIDEGWIKYHSNDGIGSSCTIPSVVLPVGADAATNPATYRVYPNSDPMIATETKNLQEATMLDQVSKGFYAYRIYISSGKPTIEGIGYYKGTKVTLKADISHAPDSYEMKMDNSVLPPVCISRNHDNDTIFIYQTGTSA